MSYDTVWVPAARWPGLAEKLRASPGLLIPHAVPSKSNPDFSKGAQFELGAMSFCMGVLLADPAGPQLLAGEPGPTSDQYRSALDTCRKDFRLASIDELCVQVAAQIREEHGHLAGTRALRRAVSLAPQAVFCRGDLVATLYVAAQQHPEAAAERLAECADHFMLWCECDSTGSKNRPAIVYFGVASLTFCGRRSDRDRALSRTAAIIAENTWLNAQIARFAALAPGDVTVLAPGQK